MVTVLAELVPVREEQLPTFALAAVDAARHDCDAYCAESTRAKHAADWRVFLAWCRERSHPSLLAHPGTVAIYVSALADRGCAPSTVGRVLAALGHHHRLADLAAPHSG